MAINVNELPKEIGDIVKRDNGISTREASMTKNQVRSHAIKVLAAISNLDKSQAHRVLRHAIKMMSV